MSREERRAYQRQMKNMERGPALPPSARQRAERNTARRAEKRGRVVGPAPAAFDMRFWVRSSLIAAAIGLVGFSVQWSEGMPRALYVGLTVAAVVMTFLVGFRLLRRRAAGLGSTDRRPR